MVKNTSPLPYCGLIRPWFLVLTAQCGLSSQWRATNFIAAILRRFGDFVEQLVLKSDKVCAIGFQKKKKKNKLTNKRKQTKKNVCGSFF